MKIDKNIGCVSDYLSIISELNKSYGFSNAPCACKFLYRGISDKAYNLIPSIFRKTHDIDITINNFIDNSKYIAYTSEKQILQSFIGEACAYIKNSPSKEFYKWAEYAQHYGVPTRFLDWSGNPLVALYFACKGDKPDYKQKENEGNIGGKDAIVWMLHLRNYRRFANQVDNIIYSNDQKKKYTIAETINKIYENEKLFEYPLVYQPYYTDLRMSAQSSMFMVWGQREEPFDSFFTEDNRMRSNKDDDGSRGFGTKQFDEMIFDFHIFSDRKQPILRELDICGINEKTLFPGLDGTGRYIEMKYRFDLEEAKEYF
jgi:hypothetical protein